MMMRGPFTLSRLEEMGDPFSWREVSGWVVGPADVHDRWPALEQQSGVTVRCGPGHGSSLESVHPRERLDHGERRCRIRDVRSGTPRGSERRVENVVGTGACRDTFYGYIEAFSDGTSQLVGVQLGIAGEIIYGCASNPLQSARVRTPQVRVVAEIEPNGARSGS